MNVSEFNAQTTLIDSALTEVAKIVDQDLPEYESLGNMLEVLTDLMEFTKEAPHHTRSELTMKLRSALDARLQTEEGEEEEPQSLSIEEHIEAYFENYIDDDDLADRSVHVPLSVVLDNCDDLEAFGDNEIVPVDYSSREEFVDHAVGEIFWSIATSMAIAIKDLFATNNVVAMAETNAETAVNIPPLMAPTPALKISPVA
jgi:hypothetical protein